MEVREAGHGLESRRVDELVSVLSLIATATRHNDAVMNALYSMLGCSRRCRVVASPCLPIRFTARFEAASRSEPYP